MSIKNIGQDQHSAKLLNARIRFSGVVANAMKAPEGYTVADAWESTCDKYPSCNAFVYTGCDRFPERIATFYQVEKAANQVAEWATNVMKLPKNSTVALYMENRIEYITFFLGFCKAGIRIAFLNNTIKGNPLTHSIRESNAKVLLVGIECIKNVLPVIQSLKNENVECVCSGGEHDSIPCIDSAISLQSTSRPSRARRSGIAFTDVLGYAFTSGTTGLPKAVNMTHLRMSAFSGAFYHYATVGDVIYSSGLPLYHMVALGLGSGCVIQYGACQVIRRKFSASHWIDDCKRYRVSIIQYIGELCRYLNASPRKPDDHINSIRLAAGNGLTKEVWVEFQTRFQIDTVLEFYGATEGNGAFSNVMELQSIREGDVAGIGCIGRAHGDERDMFRLVKYDIENEDFIRDQKTGELIDCKDEEPGECLYPVREAVPTSHFVGYTSASDTKKKLVKDKGKIYFRTGDLLVRTKDRWIKFADRIGDTFRWRGENISTTEVASELGKSDLVQEAVVFGVKLPRKDGRAGMASIVLSASAKTQNTTELSIIMSKILEHCRASLPSYAIPIFVRIQNEALVTETFKHQKTILRQQGFNPAKVNGDALFWLNPVKGTFEEFTQKDFDALHSHRKESNTVYSRL